MKKEIILMHWVDREEMLNDFIREFLSCLTIVNYKGQPCRGWELTVKYDDTKDRLRKIVFRYLKIRPEEIKPGEEK